ATGTSGVNCPACGTVWDDAQGLHAVGCAPQKATRHNAVRDFLIRKLREAHVVAHCEQTLAMVATAVKATAEALAAAHAALAHAIPISNPLTPQQKPEPQTAAPQRPFATLA